MERFLFFVSVFFSKLRFRLTILLVGPLVYENHLTMLFCNVLKGQPVLRLRDGARFLVRPNSSDRATVSEVFILKPYTSHERFRLNPADTVVDVGANIGAFSIFAAQHCPMGRIYSVEPDPDNFQVLVDNIRMNSFENIIPLNVALYSKEAELPLSSRWAHSSLYFDIGRSEQYMVKAISMKTLMEDQRIGMIDFLKMDCEGAEFDILFSLGADQLSRIRKISMEFHNVSEEKNADTLCEFLRAGGFEINHCAGTWNGLLLATNQKVSASHLRAYGERGPGDARNPGWPGHFSSCQRERALHA